jgi:hypothetical protein
MAHSGLMAGPGAAAANQQDVMSQFQHSVHGYTNNNINWYPQQVQSNSVLHNSHNHPSSKARN